MVFGMRFALWSINVQNVADYQRENIPAMIQGGNDVKKRMTITEVAEIVGISPKTLARWEKLGKIRRPKRDWRGWRVYDEGDISEIKKFHETLFEV